jgi:hypothetical protein
MKSARLVNHVSALTGLGGLPGDVPLQCNAGCSYTIVSPALGSGTWRGGRLWVIPLNVAGGGGGVSLVSVRVCLCVPVCACVGFEFEPRDAQTLSQGILTCS